MFSTILQTSSLTKIFLLLLSLFELGFFSNEVIETIVKQIKQRTEMSTFQFSETIGRVYIEGYPPYSPNHACQHLVDDRCLDGRLLVVLRQFIV